MAPAGPQPMVWLSMPCRDFRMAIMSSGRTWSTGLIHDRCLDTGELFTWTISPSSTMELLAVRLAEVFRAPLNTTKLAPVTFRSWKQEGLMLFFIIGDV